MTLRDLITAGVDQDLQILVRDVDNLPMSARVVHKTEEDELVIDWHDRMDYNGCEHIYNTVYSEWPGDIITS